MSPSTSHAYRIRWQLLPSLDEKHGWVFVEDRAPGDKSKRSLRKKRLIPTQLDLEGIPLPDLDPNQEDDATPRASLANLEGSMQNLNIDPQGTDATASEWSSSEPHTLAESSPNYLYNPPNQGSSGGATTSMYTPSLDNPSLSSTKGQSKAQSKASASHSRPGHNSHRDTRQNSNHSRGSSHRQSSWRTSTVDLGQTLQWQQQPQQQYSLASSTNSSTLPQIAESSSSLTSYASSSWGVGGLPSASETQAPPEIYDGIFGHDSVGNEAGPSTASTSLQYTSQQSIDPFDPHSSVETIRSPSSYRTFDPRFKVHHAREFKPGRVFKLEWIEAKGVPIGMNGSFATSYEPLGSSKVTRQPQDTYRSLRRFITIESQQGFCLAIPLYTYQNQGCAKPGCKPYQHGIVHDERNSSQSMPNEPQLAFPPIRIKIKAPKEWVSPATRANYYMPTPVKYNLRVVFIGEIGKEDFQLVKKAVEKGRKQAHTEWSLDDGGWPS